MTPQFMGIKTFKEAEAQCRNISFCFWAEMHDEHIITQ